MTQAGAGAGWRDEARGTLIVSGGEPEIFHLPALQSKFDIYRLPYTLRVLLENVLRHGDDADVEAIATWDPKAEPSREISFRPGRVLLQDFTGVPAIVDLAAMRDAMLDRGGNPAKVNPLIPAELVIDHSVQVDEFATRLAIRTNVDRDYERNGERYAFLRWGQRGFDNFQVAPPNTGICHQVNLEFLARVIERREENGVVQAFPDTLVGTDSHTTMVNGLGVLGWGVGGIEAEAALLGEPVSMLVPQVVGFRLTGALPEGATATDLVLTVTEILRATGVVGKFVEYFGPGLVGLPVADRATIANMSPEYGATCGFFPVDDETLTYLIDDRALEGADRARRDVLPRAGPLPRADRHADVLAGRRARPRRHRPEPRRAAATAGPRAARPHPRVLRGRDEAVRDPVRERLARQGERRLVPRERPARRHCSRKQGARRGACAGAGCDRRGSGPGVRAGDARRRADGLARARRRGDRRDHELHEHVEPVGDDRRRPRGEEGGRARASSASRG